ncbi:MAG: Ppx/GppA family phosphatase [Candidatus Scalindua sp. AMX11]|nr:MAG: Ppx/GppA family phosphatase [Candidatus Scalindua sp.]NOG82716.1 Ppx/GppA family phosphatase [Planctomycetota bacterium]RZV95286.1 MAG: Ppx/GppA family phosphatase [Candidatus Scalindua sp. SCAELEC01]TDE66234.1 MAG: Ppx/GppA family phosphatase [Candidatus Scalindua sp. AMX11]GJQ57854.1 MAG: phosphatase [Candidatus Scalindua sp.]
MKASIDLGTNTCLLLIAEVEAGRVKNVKGDYAEIVRLGEKVDQTGQLQPAAMDRALSCLLSYKKRLAKVCILPGEVVCVATSQARNGRNSAEFFLKVLKETGFRFKTITALEEARFTFYGSLLTDMDSSRYLVVDLGGGSTEFVAVDGGRSLELGSVRFTERYLTSDPVTEAQFQRCIKEIDKKLEVLKPWRNTLPDDLEMIAVAGTATTLASWHLAQEEFNANEIEMEELAKGDFVTMVDILKSQTVSERLELLGIEEGRADVILAGAMIFWRIMEKLGFSSCRISPRGLRYGVFATI